MGRERWPVYNLPGVEIVVSRRSKLQAKINGMPMKLKLDFRPDLMP